MASSAYKKQLTDYEKTELWLKWILKPKFSKYLMWGGFFLLSSVMFVVNICNCVRDDPQVTKLKRVCTQEIRGTVSRVKFHKRGRHTLREVIAEYKVGDGSYEASGRCALLRSYSPNEPIAVHFDPKNPHVAYAGEDPYSEFSWFSFIASFIPVGICALIIKIAKVGREKIFITDATGTMLTIASGDRPDTLALSSEDGYQSLVGKEQIMDIIKNGGKFVRSEGLTMYSGT